MIKANIFTGNSFAWKNHFVEWFIIFTREWNVKQWEMPLAELYSAELQTTEGSHCVEHVLLHKYDTFRLQTNVIRVYLKFLHGCQRQQWWACNKDVIIEASGPIKPNSDKTTDSNIGRYNDLELSCVVFMPVSLHLIYDHHK